MTHRFPLQKINRPRHASGWVIDVVLVFLVFATAGNAFAYRVEFITLLEGERLDGSEVCLYRGSDDDDPAALYLASSVVRCFPSDQIIDVPAGIWSFFGRHPAGYVSSHGSALVQRGPRNEDKGYQSIRIELRPAAYVKFSNATDQYAAYVPMLDDTRYAPATFPLAVGSDRIAVPADESFTILRVQEGKPVAAGPLLKLKAGAVVDATAIVPRAGERDLIAWIKVDDLSQDEIANVGPPRFTLSGPNGQQHRPLYDFRRPGAAHGGLLIFPNVPSGELQILGAGPGWRSVTVSVNISSGFLDSPIVIRMPQRLNVTWMLPSMILASVTRHESCSEETSRISALSNEWSIQVLQCPDRDKTSLSPRNLQHCQHKRTAVIDAAAIGSANFDLSTPGEYVVTLHGKHGSLASSSVIVPSGEDVVTELVSQLPMVFGRVVDGDRPVQAVINFATGSARSDAAGAYEALLATDPLDNAIEVVPCDGSEPYYHLPREPIRGTRRYDIRLPANAISISVADAITGRPVAGASIGRGLFSDIDEARNAQTRDDLTADHDGRAVLKRMEPGYFLRLCATADGYAAACAEPISLAADSVRELQIALRREKTRTGRILVQAPIIGGTLFRTTLTGVIVEEVPVSETGSFAYTGLREADVLILTSYNRPLTVVRHPPIPEVGDLEFPLHTGPTRTFSVEFAGSMPIRSGWFTIAIGDAVVPINALAAHLTRRGLTAFIDDSTPASVVDVLESGPIRVLAIVARYPETTNVGDLFVLPQYSPIRELRDLPADGRVVFARQ